MERIALIVDDIPVMRSLLCEMLRNLDFDHIELQPNGQQAWQWLTQQQHLDKNFELALIVSDWNMPGMTGLELLQAVRHSSQFRQVPFLMISGETESSLLLESVRLGADEFLSKPFNMLELKVKLNQILKAF